MILNLKLNRNIFKDCVRSWSVFLDAIRLCLSEILLGSLKNQHLKFNDLMMKCNQYPIEANIEISISSVSLYYNLFLNQDTALDTYLFW